ncbi:MAG: hypothetical protein ACD_45C00096G0002 [uncultured bacterium]|nr:MAG: hypothetical protein ACD_45C00096G0002 [uncultured bacterium]
MVGCKMHNSLTQNRWEAFLAHGLPNRSNERFKYHDFSFLLKSALANATRLDETAALRECVDAHRLREKPSILLVLVNGYFVPALSDLERIPDDAIVTCIHEARTLYPDWVEQYGSLPIDQTKYPFAELNAQSYSDGLFIYLKAGCNLTDPIHLLSIGMNTEAFIAQPHHIIVLDIASRLTLIEEYVSLHDAVSCLTNVLMNVVLKEKTFFNHCKIQNEQSSALHCSNTFIKQKKDSQSVLTHFSKGGVFSREDWMVLLEEMGASCMTAGLYHAKRNHQSVAHYVDIKHAAPACRSDMLYKGIADKKSRAIFDGRLSVDECASKTVATQTNRHLLLSKDAEAYSKPSLEINAQDVSCKHGATTGHLDSEVLLYLRSRGISYQEAIEIFLSGFSEEVIQRVMDPAVRAHVREAMSVVSE